MRPHAGSIIRGILEGINEETGQELTLKDVAKRLDTTPKTLSAILNEHQGISPKMAIRLSAAFGYSAEFWLKLHQKPEKSANGFFLTIPSN